MRDSSALGGSVSFSPFGRLDAEGGPAAVLLELLPGPGPRQGSLVADEFRPEGLHEGGGAHLADAEEPLDVAVRE